MLIQLQQESFESIMVPNRLAIKALQSVLHQIRDLKPVAKYSRAKACGVIKGNGLKIFFSPSMYNSDLVNTLFQSFAMMLCKVHLKCLTKYLQYRTTRTIARIKL